MIRHALLPTLTVVALLGGCQTTGMPTADKLEPHECGSVKRVHTYAGIFLASQPNAEDFEHAKKSGIKTIVNMRHAAEHPAE